MSGPISPPLTVTTVGGTPEGRPITTIRVSNGDLTISGNVATIDTSGSGGGGTVTSIATTAPITGGTITTTGTIGIDQADGSTDGYLSSTDWNTFDAKQDTITLSTTGTSGAATLIGATLNIPNYTNTATISGSIAANQVAYGAAADEIQGSANLTFDGSNLDVSGYISAGGIKVSPSGAGTITTTSTEDLVLSTNGGTDSGTITITDGANGQISITPNGTGEVVAGNYRLDVDETVGASQDGYALTYTNSTGLISLKEVSGGSGTVTVGTYAGANNVAYFSGATEISNTNNISVSAVTGDLDCFGSVEAGNVKIGTNTNKNTVETSSAQDLVLRTNSGTNSGTIEITNGTNGAIKLTPNGTGTVSLGNFVFDADQTVSASEDNYVLTYDDASGLISLEEAGGGGGSPAGSDTEIQYNDSSSFGASDRFAFSPDVGGSGNASMGIKSNGASFLSNGFVIYAEGNAYISSQVFGNEFLCASSSSSDVGFGPQTDQNTGIAFSAADQVDIVTGGAYNVSFGSSKEMLLGGTDAGTSGQVLTSGGAGAAVTWGGAGSGFKQPAIATGAFLTSNNKYPCFTSAPYGTSQIIDSDTSADYDTNPCMRPFVLAEGGTWGGVAINVVSASSGNALLVSLYNSDSDGMPTSFVGYCEVDTTSTGNITQTTTLDSGGSSATITLAKDTQYWCSFVAKSSSDTCTLMSVAADALSGFGGANMQNEYTLLRNTFVSNDIETNNPPRNTQTLSDRDAPHIGIII